MNHALRLRVSHETIVNASKTKACAWDSRKIKELLGRLPFCVRQPYNHTFLKYGKVDIEEGSGMGKDLVSKFFPYTSKESKIRENKS